MLFNKGKKELGIKLKFVICIWKIYKILSNRKYSKQVFFYFNQLDADKQRKKIKTHYVKC